MFNLFKKSKPKKKSTDIVQDNGPDISHLSAAKQQLFLQLKAKREELGPAEIAKMQRAVEMQALRNKIKDDIENDEVKRQRLIDEIRFHMQDK